MLKWHGRRQWQGREGLNDRYFMDDGWTQSIYFLPLISSSLRGLSASLHCFYLMWFYTTTLLSHSGKWNWNVSSHRSPLSCVYTAAYSTVVLQPLIENENWHALKWMSPMMAFCRKLRSCQFLLFSHQMGYFYKDISAFQGQIGISLICSNLLFSGHSTSAQHNWQCKRSKWNPLPLESFSG